MDKKIFNRYGYENISTHILPYLWTALEETQYQISLLQYLSAGGYVSYIRGTSCILFSHR
jgi:hypothetical protein